MRRSSVDLSILQVLVFLRLTVSENRKTTIPGQAGDVGTGDKKAASRWRLVGKLVGSAV
jgi:hypothetical protein